ncbi:MAG: class I SAM-dependent methyltransferase [Acidimicrobiia bacterium]|nr:class I SAM-dependent methyltransferase [Acidimicrobiia bacterium]
MHHPLLARFYDTFLWPGERLGMASQRDRLVGHLSGTVLEVAVGTGLNLPHYPATVTVDAIEIDPHMLRKAKSRAAEAICDVRLHEADVHRLPFEDKVFDHAVVSLALCTIPEPGKALAEIARVVRGDVHFLEHVRSPSPARARWQHRVAPAWSRFAGGCRLGQDTEAVITAAGYTITDMWRSSGGGMIQGVAKPASDDR